MVGVKTNTAALFVVHNFRACFGNKNAKFSIRKPIPLYISPILPLPFPCRTSSFLKRPSRECQNKLKHPEAFTDTDSRNCSDAFAIFFRV